MFVIAVTVKEVFFHCTKCIVRSGLWSSDHHDDTLVSFGEAFVNHAKLDISIEEANALMREAEQTELY
jgi:hypothetical protein